MAKHYSGKRAAGRKPVGKRALSLLMALVMSLSLVQITAFAVEEITNYRVVEQGTEVSDNAGLVTIKKTATHKTDDQFDINLSVTVKKTEETTVTNNPAHIVLVMDRSNSMEENSGRFANARKAAKTFVSALLKGNDTENDNGNRIAVVGFGTKADTGTAFSNDVEKLNGWIESATKAYKNSDDGGTNIQAGIHEAQRLLKNDGFTGKKIIVVFSDGMPTYSYRAVGSATWVGCDTEGFLGLHRWNKNNGGHIDDSTVKYSFDYRDRVGSGGSYDYKGGSFGYESDFPYLKYTCAHGYSDKEETRYYETNGDATIAEAQIAQAAGTEIYSVYLGGSDEQQNKNALETMKGIVSDAEKNFLSTNKMEDLAKLFGQIAQTITTETSGLTVSDPMGDFITLGDVQALVDAGVITLAEDGRSFTWILANTPAANVTEDKTAGTTTYTLTYPVTLNAADPDFVSDTAYPTNGTTTLTYYVTGDRNAHTLDFVVPTVTATKATTPEPPVENEYIANVKYYYSDTGINGEYKYRTDATVTVKAAELPANFNIPGKSDGGYTFNGSYTADKQAVSALENQTLEKDRQEFHVYYYKDTTPEPEKVSYTVNYFLEQGGTYAKEPTYTATIELAEEGEITIGDLYTAYPTAPVGYELDEAMLNEDFGNVRPGTCTFTDGQVFNLYYKVAEVEPEKVSYTVNYFLEQGGTYAKDPTYTDTIELAEEGEITIAALKVAYPDAPVGYVLDEAMLNEDFGNVRPGTYTFTDGQVFNLYYKLAEVEPEGPFTYWVQHIYMNGATIDGKTYDEVTEVPYGTEVDPMAIEPVLKYTTEDGVEHVYEVESRDPMEKTLITENDQVFTIFYQRNDPAPEYITVTVNYVEKDNTSNVLRNSQSEQFELVGGVAAYDVTGLKFNSLTKGGTTYSYDSADAALTGKVESDLTITLYYKAESNTPVNPPVGPTVTYYTVTVNYYDKDSGAVIHEKYSTTQREYTTYDVTAQDKIAITGYTYVETTGDALTGTLNGNKVINVYYTKDSDIDDGDTPADPGTDIGDDDVPVTPAQPPKTGDSMGLWIAAAMVSGMGLVWLSLSGKKRKEEI